MDLSSKQKSYLRGRGQRLNALASVGKAGLSEGVISGIGHLLDQHELVKVHIPAGSGQDRDGMAGQLAAACHAAMVGLVGRMVLLYRPSEQLAPHRRIELPQSP